MWRKCSVHDLLGSGVDQDAHDALDEGHLRQQLLEARDADVEHVQGAAHCAALRQRHDGRLHKELGRQSVKGALQLAPSDFRVDVHSFCLINRLPAGSFECPERVRASGAFTFVAIGACMPISSHSFVVNMHCTGADPRANHLRSGGLAVVGITALEQPVQGHDGRRRRLSKQHM